MTRAGQVFRADETNVGDWWCPPSRYFDLQDPAVGDIKDLDLETLADHVVVGGGGLISANFDARMARLAAARPRLKSLVAWGIGESLLNDKTGGRVERYDGPLPDWLEAFDLVGLRDVGHGHRWVPCASCMLPGFDAPAEVRHPVVVYEHKRIPIPAEGAPHRSNEGDDIDAVLDFLASGEVVVTNSYHGAYWATLLGRRVVALPSLSKLHRMKHPPLIAWHDDWRDRLGETRVWPKALDECRAANRAFYDDVRRLQSA
ncbi:MAG: hypothetical protein EON88_32725 [Brevundimonas sp.]|nr:MAG: hypothetical protein EON88_32725 [Brevundimonas sp.]